MDIPWTYIFMLLAIIGVVLFLASVGKYYSGAETNEIQ